MRLCLCVSQVSNFHPSILFTRRGTKKRPTTTTAVAAVVAVAAAERLDGKYLLQAGSALAQGKTRLKFSACATSAFSGPACSDFFCYSDPRSSRTASWPRWVRTVLEPETTSFFFVFANFLLRWQKMKKKVLERLWHSYGFEGDSRGLHTCGQLRLNRARHRGFADSTPDEIWCKLTRWGSTGMNASTSYCYAISYQP